MFRFILALLLISIFPITLPADDLSKSLGLLKVKLLTLAVELGGEKKIEGKVKPKLQEDLEREKRLKRLGKGKVVPEKELSISEKYEQEREAREYTKKKEEEQKKKKMEEIQNIKKDVEEEQIKEKKEAEGELKGKKEAVEFLQEFIDEDFAEKTLNDVERFLPKNLRFLKNYYKGHEKEINSVLISKMSNFLSNYPIENVDKNTVEKIMGHIGIMQRALTENATENFVEYKEKIESLLDKKLTLDDETTVSDIIFWFVTKRSEKSATTLMNDLEKFKVQKVYSVLKKRINGEDFIVKPTLLLDFFHEIIPASIINKIIPHLVKIIIKEEDPGNVEKFIENLTYLNQTIKDKKFKFIANNRAKINLLLSLSKSNKEWDEGWMDFKESHSIGKLSKSITNLFKKFKNIYAEKKIFNDDKIQFPVFSSILSGTYAEFFQDFMLKILEGEPGASERNMVWIILIQLDFIQEYLSLNYQTVKEFKMAPILEEINKSRELKEVDAEINSLYGAVGVLSSNNNLKDLEEKLNQLYNNNASKEETEPIRNAIVIYNKIKLHPGAQYFQIVNAISDAITDKLQQKEKLENNIKQLKEKEKNMSQEQKEKEQEIFSLEGKIKALSLIIIDESLALTPSQKLWITTESKNYVEKKDNLEKEPEIREEELDVREEDPNDREEEPVIEEK